MEDVSEATENRYTTDLRRFLKFIFKTKQVFDVEEIKAADIREYFVSLKNVLLLLVPTERGYHLPEPYENH